MLGIELRPWDNCYLFSYFSDVGFLVPIVSSYLLNIQNLVTAYALNSQNILRIAPSLTISKNEIDRIVNSLAELCSLIDLQKFDVIFEHLLTPSSDSDINQTAVVA
jgi:acetylornithine/succinyldiaminopimelate/putrescine aminotransferase